MSDLKAQIRQVMMQHLYSKGYPNLTSKQILGELKPMWIKLGEAKLLHPEWKFNEYVSIAHAKEHLANLKAALQEDMLKHFVKRMR